MAARLPFMAHDQTFRAAVKDQAPNVFVFRCWPTGASIKLALHDLHNGSLRPDFRQHMVSDRSVRSPPSIKGENLRPLVASDHGRPGNQTAWESEGEGIEALVS